MSAAEIIPDYRTELDLRDLRYFQAIAEMGHLGHAGDVLGRSQPALTKCVRRLEASLGVELFVRKGRGIELTPVGEMLLVQTRRLRNSAAVTFREIQGFARGEAGRVRLGCGPISAEQRLPALCDLVLKQARGVTLQITIAMNYTLREQMRRGEIELIFGMVHEPDEEFVSKPLAEDVVVVAAGRDHPIFSLNAPTIEDLLAYEWVLPVPQVPSRRWLDQAFEANGLPTPRARIEANTVPIPQDMIANSDLLCFTSRRTLDGASPLREVAMEALTLRRRAGLTYPREDVAPPVKRLIELLSSRTAWLAGEG